MSPIEQIMAIMDAAFEPQWGEKWTRGQIADSLLIPNTSAIVIDGHGHEIAHNEGTAAGFVLSRHAAGEEELLLIAVHPQHRRKGLGRKLIEMLKERARARQIAHIFLQMRANNPAVHLYEAAGFTSIGMRKEYYRTADGSRLDAITYALSV
ncbi:MAG: ribosomal-protein-alanine acetyltransferase [Erythrobacter sp. RIFCSPHIGHO2_12_FULL_63_10]|nr:MAG: ribosomal-protein-alanine acetyltransferase [Erythrobacter sp. RIFCSPHIGHO2_12_FULL_63_10]